MLANYYFKIFCAKMWHLILLLLFITGCALSVTGSYVKINKINSTRTSCLTIFFFI